MLHYICTACGKKTPVTTMEPKCACGGVFELDFTRKSMMPPKLTRTPGVFSATASLWRGKVTLGKT